MQSAQKSLKNVVGSYDTIYLCTDDALQQPQAVALTKNHTLYSVNREVLGPYSKIVHIVTNPSNIRSKINEREYGRVEGSATKIIHKIARQVLQENTSGIYLEATDSAIPFYEKLGFEQLNKTEIDMVEDLTTPMRLTLEKIKSIF